MLTLGHRSKLHVNELEKRKTQIHIKHEQVCNSSREGFVIYALFNEKKRCTQLFGVLTDIILTNVYSSDFQIPAYRVRFSVGVRIQRIH